MGLPEGDPRPPLPPPLLLSSSPLLYSLPPISLFLSHDLSISRTLLRVLRGLVSSLLSCEYEEQREGERGNTFPITIIPLSSLPLSPLPSFLTHSLTLCLCLCSYVSRFPLQSKPVKIKQKGFSLVCMM